MRLTKTESLGAVEEVEDDADRRSNTRASDNPNEAIIPPHPSEVPDTRLSTFSCGGIVSDYIGPNDSFDELLFSSSFGGLNEVMKTKFGVLFTDTKLEALFSGLSSSSRTECKSAWIGWGRFCFVRGIPVWLHPGTPGRGEPLLGFLIWTSKVLGRKASTLKGRFADIRFMHLANGNLDFTVQAYRAKALIKGLKKHEGVQRKQPSNTDLLRWMRKELICKTASRNTGMESMNYELYTARILGFFFLFRISEMEALKWEDISVETQDGKKYVSIRIKQSKTDISKDGILRSLIEVDSVLCPVATFTAWKRMAFREGDEKLTCLGKDCANGCLL